MPKFYFGRIDRGKLTIDDVPEKWKSAVQALIDEASKDEEPAVSEEVPQ